MIESEKKKLTLTVDSEIVKKARKDPDINISEITEKVLRAFTASSKTEDNEKRYDAYQELFDLMLPLLRKFKVMTKIADIPNVFHPSDDEDWEPDLGPEGEVINDEEIVEWYSIFLRPNGELDSEREGEIEIKDISINGLMPGLTIIPVGNKPSNTCELFASDRMKQFASYLRERFDYVVIDTPPVLAFPDTAILSPLSDGVVFVINCKNTRKTVVKRAIDTLHDCKIMGFVLNMSEAAAVDYYGYTSGYYYYDYASS